MIKQLGVVVIGAALMTPFMAQAEGAYVGFNAGRSNQKVNLYNEGTYKDSATAYKLYGGYEFNRYFGVEGGYVNMGKTKFPFISSIGTPGISDVKTNAFYVAATGIVPINEQFSVFGKLGMSRNSTKIRDVVASVVTSDYKQTRTTPLIGIGAAYQFSKNLAAVVEYENYGKVVKDVGGNVKTNLFSVGLRYKF